MDLLREYFIPWLFSNVIAVLFLIIAMKRPKLGRLFCALLFAWACWINYTTAHKNPNDYLLYADLTPIDLYYDFINGWFKLHIIPMVTFISIGQGLIAGGMLLRGRIVQYACFGAIFFLLAIAPLGIGSGFPSTLIASAAIIFILRKDDLNFIWSMNGKIVGK